MRHRTRKLVYSGLMSIAFAVSGAAIARTCHSVSICGPDGTNCVNATLCCYASGVCTLAYEEK